MFNHKLFIKLSYLFNKNNLYYMDRYIHNLYVGLTLLKKFIILL
jgi:hypothetical protein